ncbi:MAG: hypothetical protein KHZ62_00830 [Clostridiales bacterium]|nr:hypothetical protein [Clostridiales bacterium]
MSFSISQEAPVYKDSNNQPIAQPRNTGTNALDMDSFLQLLAAQISNQDILNPNSNTDYMNQMAQMSMVQAVNDMMLMSLTTYASSMIGKEVVVAEVNGSNVEKVEGVVTGVSIYGSEPILHINGKDYALSQVMVIGKMPEKPEKPENPDGSEGDGETGGVEGGGTEGNGETNGTEDNSGDAEQA